MIWHVSALPENCFWSDLFGGHIGESCCNNKKRKRASFSPPHWSCIYLILKSHFFSLRKEYTSAASQCCCEGDNKQNLTWVRGKEFPWIISILKRNKSLPRGMPLSLITKRRSPMDYFWSAVRCQAFDVGNGIRLHWSLTFIPAGSSTLTFWKHSANVDIPSKSR